MPASFRRSIICHSHCYSRNACMPLQQKKSGFLTNRLPPYRRLTACLLVLLACLCPGLIATAGSASAPVPVRHEAVDASILFRDEIQQVEQKLRWRGEKLTDDTRYAIALTGLSWESAWGREHLFSMVSATAGPTAAPTERAVSRKGSGRSRDSLEYVDQASEVRRAYLDRDFRRALSAASTNFLLEEIAVDPVLKEAVGVSFVELGQPERAFPIFAALFQPKIGQGEPEELNRKFRLLAFEAAQRSHLEKESIAFTLSLLLEPGKPDAMVDRQRIAFLERNGVDLDRVLLGILEAPERLRGLPNYGYAAADLLAVRASPRFLPILLHLVDSSDVHFRSRALLGLGIIGYRPQSGEPQNWSASILPYTSFPLREYGISVGQRQRIDREIDRAAASDNYRLRTAAALAAALCGGEEGRTILQKLRRDRSYLLSPLLSNGSRQLAFPVRLAAMAGLARYSMNVAMDSSASNFSANFTSGELSGKPLDALRHGNQEVTNDRRGLRHFVASQLLITPSDRWTAAPAEPRTR